MLEPGFELGSIRIQIPHQVASPADAGHPAFSEHHLRWEITPEDDSRSALKGTILDIDLNFPFCIFSSLKRHKTDLLTLPQDRSSYDPILPFFPQNCQQFLIR